MRSPDQNLTFQPFRVEIMEFSLLNTTANSCNSVAGNSAPPRQWIGAMGQKNNHMCGYNISPCGYFTGVKKKHFSGQCE